MAIAAILFSLWYTEIAKALETQVKKHREDNVGARRIVTAVLFAKALPVAVMSLAVALIFSPDAWRLVVESWRAFQTDGLAAFQRYDAVRTSYCFVTLFSIVLALYMWVLAFHLWTLRRQLG